MDKKMKTFSISKTDSINYNPEFIDEDTLSRMLKLDVSGMTSEGVSKVAKTMKATAAVTAADITGDAFNLTDIASKEEQSNEKTRQMVFNQAMDLFQDDPDLADAIDEVLKKRKSEKDEIVKLLHATSAPQTLTDLREIGYTRLNFSCNPDTEVDPAIVRKVEDRLKVDVTHGEDEIKYHINGVTVMTLAAKVKSPIEETITIVMRWAPVVLDIFGIVAAAAGLIPSRASTGKTNAVVKVLVKWWGKLKVAFKKLFDLIGKIKHVVDRVSENIKPIWDMIKNILSVFSKTGTLLKDTVKCFFMGKAWYHIILDIILLAASVALLFLSAGSGLVIKILTLIVLFTVLVVDVTRATIEQLEPGMS